jgi:aryl-alcohol dehydrogenase-like predicted oxidoreductase
LTTNLKKVQPCFKPKVYEREEKLKSSLGAEAANLAERVLRFTLSQDGVISVIPGMRSINHVTAKLSCSDGRSLSAETLAKLKAFALDRTGE